MKKNVKVAKIMLLIVLNAQDKTEKVMLLIVLVILDFSIQVILIVKNVNINA